MHLDLGDPRSRLGDRDLGTSSVFESRSQKTGKARRKSDGGGGGEQPVSVCFPASFLGG